jgi:hypothetical protein
MTPVLDLIREKWSLVVVLNLFVICSLITVCISKIYNECFYGSGRNSIVYSTFRILLLVSNNLHEIISPQFSNSGNEINE